MLLWFLDWLARATLGRPVCQSLEKTTLRGALAAVIGFALALLFGRQLIAWLHGRFREPIKTASARVAQLHAAKQATPTMGGLFIAAGIVISTALLADMRNPLVWLGVLLTIALAALGAIDDLAKLRTAARGLSPRAKLAGQSIIALAVALGVYAQHRHTPGALALDLPLVGISLPLGLGFVPLAVLVLVGASNAVNLADGLDGLAGGCLLLATAAMGALVYASGHAGWAEYLGVAHIPHAAEVVVLAAGVLGAILGFLWFNCYPASVFMGDTGSLPLGGLLGYFAIVCRQELMLMIVGGVFVVEAASVLLQIGSCRLRQKRLLLCAPLHHHFQFLGWAENKIVVRFWIASALAAIAGLGIVKLDAQLAANPAAIASNPADQPAVNLGPREPNLLTAGHNLHVQ
ncbi:MAG TPA: phospho-N-acetylmuramoyl-pentapeptide-transferase [Pirellulales bacterium]|jgi:phospho-N-acetylmuramoyl-pentapeptide-transferase|nr:phospho-N-acetylmuramoyl-pentapeptide-transferase [Pirellulales bacterium]